MKKIISIILAVAMVAALAACGGGNGQAPAATTADSNADAADTGSDRVDLTFRLSLGDNEASNYYKGAMAIAEEVEKATDGQIKIDVYASGVLGNEPESLELCQTGDIDIATIASSKLVSFIPEMAILDQAYLYTSAEQAHAAIEGDLAGLIDEAAGKIGVHYIGAMESGFRNMFTTRPVTCLDDFKGLKIRTMTSDSHMLAFNSFGAIATPLDYNEQFTALQTGAIDACENAISNMLANGFNEYCPYVTWTNHAYVYILMFLSDNAWNSIPDDLKESFLEGVKAGYHRQWQYLIDANNEAIGELEKLGVTFYDIDTKELQAIYQEAAEKAGMMNFDPQWQAALDKAIASVG